MERLVDPLTTIDAKLWADEFMKVRARLGEQEFDHAVMLGWFANAIMQGYDEGQRRAKADAQATVEALQRERDGLEAKCLEEHVTIEQADAKVMKLEGDKGMWANERRDLLTQLENAESQLSQLQALVRALQRELESANALLHKKNCAIGKAETTIQALQRERDEYARMWRDGCNDRGEAHKEIGELTAALDAEREKVKGLEDKLDLFLSAEHIMTVSWKGKVADRDKQLADLQAQLSALQALEAMTERERVRYRQALCSIATSTCCVGCEEAKKVARATLSEDVQTWEQYRASLDATTPARGQG